MHEITSSHSNFSMTKLFVMALNKKIDVFERGIYSLSKFFNGLGAGALSIMMFLTALDVFLRYLFNRPISGAYEITEFLMTITVTFGFAYAVVQREHIIIDLLASRFNKRIEALMSNTTCLLSIGVLAILMWRGMHYAGSMGKGGYVTQSLSIPLYPFVYTAAGAFILFFLVLLFKLRDQIREASKDSRAWMRVGIVLGLTLVVLFSCIPFLRETSIRLTPTSAGIIGVVLLLIFVFSGIYLGIAMALVGFLGLAYVISLKAAFGIMGTTPYTSVASYTFSVIPLFILMGSFCFHAGLSKDLYFAAHKLIGHFPGGLAMATVGGCASFAAVSGSSMATVATMGKVALPQMKKYGYDLRLAAGSIVSGGSIGILIPPSTILVIYGILTQQSIGKLFLGGFIPGILEALFYMLTIAIICTRNPLLGPKAPKASRKERVLALRSTYAVLVLFVIVIGGIYFGVFTPTEAAGIGAFGALIITFIRKRLTWNRFTSSLNETVTTSASLFLILIGTMIFSSFLAATRLPFELTEFVAGLELNRYVILFILIVFYLLVGAFLDIFSVSVLTIPIVFPVIEALGFDPIWFGIIVVRLFEMGAITPPIGVNAFVFKGVAKDIPFSDIYKGVVPFFITDLFHVGFLILFPSLVTFLPSLMS